MCAAPLVEPRSSRVVLASASPRRRRLFAWYGVPFEVAAVDIDETPDPALGPDIRVIAGDIASRKARAAAVGFPDDVVVSCDTLVFLEGELLGKPADLEDAYRMLHALSGREHQVVTGVAVMRPGDTDPVNLAVMTNVHMRGLSEEDVATWVEDGELMGCAGAYNIEKHLAYVDDDECYQNVAGLPLCHLYLLLASVAELAAGVVFERPDATCDATRGAYCKLGPCMLGHCC